ncbi:DUF2029 domain-containing protein [Corynebacterium sp. sy017]|nr:DUF2029 domain-containing protein [Corynebacterium sp. sy017]TSD92294.1 DUF2029 domain-containing protein [Corynebacterium sp. SY003]
MKLLQTEYYFCAIKRSRNFITFERIALPTSQHYGSVCLVVEALRKRLSTVWVSQSRATTTLTTLPLDTSKFDVIGNAALWPIAIFTLLHRYFILCVNGNTTDDFSTVYNAVRRSIEGVAVYSENYYFVDPHYLYNPGATLLLTPVALLSDASLARLLFILVNMLAIIFAIGFLLKSFAGYRLSSLFFPAALIVAFHTEAVRNTIVFGNINGILLLALTTFLWAQWKNKEIIAGIIIGLAILVKPLFLPLLFIPFIKVQWKTIVLGIAVPVLMNLIAWNIIPQAGDYLSIVTPYLGEVRNYANSSLAGVFVYFGFPEWIHKIAFAFFALVIIAGLFFLLRIREKQPLEWAIYTASLLLTGVFLLSSLGQMYYSLFLFPLVFTIAKKGSIVANPVAWIAFYLCLSADLWESDEWFNFGHWFVTVQATLAWALLIIVISITAIYWYYSENPTMKKGSKETHDQVPIS